MMVKKKQGLVKSPRLSVTEYPKNERSTIYNRSTGKRIRSRIAGRSNQKEKKIMGVILTKRTHISWKNQQPLEQSYFRVWYKRQDNKIKFVGYFKQHEDALNTSDFLLIKNSLNIQLKNHLHFLNINAMGAGNYSKAEIKNVLEKKR